MGRGALNSIPPDARDMCPDCGRHRCLGCSKPTLPENHRPTTWEEYTAMGSPKLTWEEYDQLPRLLDF